MKAYRTIEHMFDDALYMILDACCILQANIKLYTTVTIAMAILAHASLGTLVHDSN